LEQPINSPRGTVYLDFAKHGRDVAIGLGLTQANFPEAKVSLRPMLQVPQDLQARL
jgi:hypothetical protein